MIKIDIFSGFLGAGKTTLIKKLLEEAFQGEKVVLIENEFGEIGIDGGFLKDAGIEITEMNSGCICCSLVGDFGEALKKVISEYAPDRILIEPSGVGKLSDVMAAVQKVAVLCAVELNSLVTVVNGMKCKVFMKNFGEFFNNQVEYAKTVIISRTQNMKPEKLDEAVRLIREKNKSAAVITTPWDALTGDKLLEVMEQNISLADQIFEEADICPCCGHHHDDGEACGDEHEHRHDHEHDHGHHHEHDHGHGYEHGHGHHQEHEHHHEGHHHADDVFTSWGVETPHKYDKADMEAILKALSETDAYGKVLRAKGMVEGKDGGWIYFDLVPQEYELRSGQPEYTGRICVIGTDLKTDALSALFHI